MGTLGYTATVSVDGFAADAQGDFQWSAPSGDVFDFHVERMAEVSTEVLGRKTFVLMRYWEDLGEGDDVTPAEREFARRWRAIDKVAVSSTLTPSDLGPDRVRLLPDLELAELRRIVGGAPGAVEIFGPTVASPAIRAGLVDDFRFFVVPKVVGGGLRAMPDGAQLDLVLAEHRLFENGVTYLHYRAGQG